MYKRQGCVWSDESATDLGYHPLPTARFVKMLDSQVNWAFARSTHSSRQGLQALLSTLTLDGTQSGVFECKLHWEVASGSTSQIQFVTGEPTAVSNIIFISDIWATSAYTGATVHGDLVSSIAIANSGGNKVGDMYFYLAKNSLNQVGYYMTFEPTGTEPQTAGTVNVTARIALIRN